MRDARIARARNPYGMFYVLVFLNRDTKAAR